MTFVLHPLSHYNSITEPRARFLHSILEHLTIDFPFHFILSIINVYRDMTTYDKLIFPSVITRILHHFSIPFPISNHFHVMCAIDAAIVKRSEAQLHSRQSGIHSPLPFSLQIIAPTSEVLNSEKIVTSKFNLNIDSRGGCHICTPVCLIGIINYSWAWWKSSKYSLAFCLATSDPLISPHGSQHSFDSKSTMLELKIIQTQL